jgi:hypothetical protein
MRRPRTLSHARARTAPRTPLTAVPLVALGLLLAACGGGVEADAGGAAPAPDTRSTETTPAPITTSTAALSPEDEVLAAVDGYWRTYFEANDPPDPNHPGFDRYFTGEAKAKSVANTQDRVESGRSIRSGPDGAFSATSRIMSVDGDRAQVAACVVDDSITVDTRTGQVLNDSTYTFRFILVVDVVSESWKVSGLTEVGRNEGIDPTCTGIATS